MPPIAFLECTRCHHHLTPNTPQTLCPLCSGSLYVRYDLDAIKHTISRDTPAARAAASTTSLGMWRYADVPPAGSPSSPVTPVSLGEGWTPLLRSKRYPG